jgi:hypothetical protein
MVDGLKLGHYLWAQAFDKRRLSIYTATWMIKSFRHRGLRRLFEQDDASGLKQDQVRRIRRALFLLDNAASLTRAPP